MNDECTMPAPSAVRRVRKPREVETVGGGESGARALICGKLPDHVGPVATSWPLASTPTEYTASSPEPPTKRAYVVSSAGESFATNPSDVPLMAPPVVTGKFGESVAPPTYTFP